MLSLLLIGCKFSPCYDSSAHLVEMERESGDAVLRNTHVLPESTTGSSPFSSFLCGSCFAIFSSPVSGIGTSFITRELFHEVHVKQTSAHEGGPMTQPLLSNAFPDLRN